jgi:hypothetical protein
MKAHRLIAAKQTCPSSTFANLKHPKRNYACAGTVDDYFNLDLPEIYGTAN